MLLKFRLYRSVGEAADFGFVEDLNLNPGGNEKTIPETFAVAGFANRTGCHDPHVPLLNAVLRQHLAEAAHRDNAALRCFLSDTTGCQRVTAQ